MTVKSFTQIVFDLNNFMQEYGINSKCNAVNIEREWTDYRFTINDSKQMHRINTWLKSDIRSVVGWESPIEISAPMPLPDHVDQLRVRVYGNN